MRMCLSDIIIFTVITIITGIYFGHHIYPSSNLVYPCTPPHYHTKVTFVPPNAHNYCAKYAATNLRSGVSSECMLW